MRNSRTRDLNKARSVSLRERIGNTSHPPTPSTSRVPVQNDWVGNTKNGSRPKEAPMYQLKDEAWARERERKKKEKEELEKEKDKKKKMDEEKEREEERKKLDAELDEMRKALEAVKELEDDGMIEDEAFIDVGKPADNEEEDDGMGPVLY
ncbi:hypothetical protein M378DRAFT_170971 [Amanita muscaria Koide BX008]|uniref:Uncharacterized protein n=1 Tax=Amanita muscaria (strain Koide BX008) TaxID=946122 RepID=A0A0C2S5T3_AMAMK|nr:hypothetical protein M378DRAFT_170971 [Amanita muscaria Koide BX008]